MIAVHHAYMVKRRLKPRYQRNYIREWRESPLNSASLKLTLEELVERLREAQGLEITHASLSRIERGLQPYSTPILEAVANELTGGNTASLLMRNPALATDLEGLMWSVWDHAKPGEKRTIVDIAKTIIRRRHG